MILFGLGRHREELIAQPLSHPGPLYQPREVGDLDRHEPPAVLAARICRVVLHVELLVYTDRHDARDSCLGRLGGKGIVGDLTREKRHRVEEGRLPRVCLADYSYSDNHEGSMPMDPCVPRDKKIPRAMGREPTSKLSAPHTRRSSPPHPSCRETKRRLARKRRA